MAGRWESVAGPVMIFQDDPRLRGSFHLAVDVWDKYYIWNQVQQLTMDGHFGYLSSLSPGPMTNGQLRGKWTISIHTLHAEKEFILRSLEYWNLGQYVFKYDLIRRFRHLFNAEEFYNGFSRF